MNKDGTNNFTYLYKPSKATVSSNTKSEKMNFIIKNINVQKTDFVFNDKTLKEPFSYHLKDISVQSKDFKFEGQNNFQFSAHLQDGGEIKAKWHGDMDGIKNQNIKLFITNLALKDLAPYCYEYFTCPITKGLLSFKSQNIISNYNLKG